MSRFIDEVRIEASSGAGGPGLVAFRREKFVHKGGPWGGDGGRGGDVILLATRDRNTLSHLRFKQHIKAGNGVAVTLDKPEDLITRLLVLSFGAKFEADLKRFVRAYREVTAPSKSKKSKRA